MCLICTYLGPVPSFPVKKFDHDLCVYDLDYIKVFLYKSSTLYEEKDESSRQNRALGMSENLEGEASSSGHNLPLVEIRVK